MTDAKAKALFTLADRAFWLIWFAFPLVIWIVVREVLNVPAAMAAMAPDQAACLADIPQVAKFSPAGRAIFWGFFSLQFAVYALLLALAHRVIHRCAKGRIFVAEMIGSLRMIGGIIACWPLLDLCLQNLTMLAYVATGDLASFVSSYALDLPTLGIGVLLLVMAAAMRMAVAMQRDADLTI